MYYRLTEDLKAPLETAVRRMRLFSSIIYYPVIVVVAAALAMAFFYTKGHGLLWALRDVFGDQFSEGQIMIGLVVILLAAAAVVIVILLRSMVREEIFEEHPFCAACNAVNKDDEGICPICGQPLREKHSFFVTHFDDESRLAERFGLTLTNEV